MAQTPTPLANMALEAKGSTVFTMMLHDMMTRGGVNMGTSMKTEWVVFFLGNYAYMHDQFDSISTGVEIQCMYMYMFNT